MMDETTKEIQRLKGVIEGLQEELATIKKAQTCINCDRLRAQLERIQEYIAICKRNKREL
jgi:prefoldin subunit 5